MFSKDSYDKNYSQRPFELRVPGDSLKDKIIYNIINNNNELSTDKKNLLDLGCGMGHSLISLSKLVNTIGIDFSMGALKTGKNKANASFICGDVQNLPFANASFDYIIAKDIIEHVPDDHKVINEIHRVCKRGARIIIYVPHDLDGFNLSIESLVKKVTGYSIDPEVGHLRRYTMKNFIELFNNRGFYVINSKYFFVHFSLGFAALLSVMGYKQFILNKNKKNNKDSKFLTSNKIFIIKKIFKLFEFLGLLEYKLLKNVPGAGFFIIATCGAQL